MSQRRGESWRLEPPLGDQPAIGPVHRRSEEGGGQEIEISTPIDARLADERQGLAERLDHGGAEEIAAQLDEVRGLGLIPDGERLLPHRLEERQTGVDGVRGAGGNDEQLGRRCHLGPPEDRCGDETLAGVRVRRAEPFR